MNLGTCAPGVECCIHSCKSYTPGVVICGQAHEFEEERAKAAAAQDEAAAKAKELQDEVERVEEHQARLEVLCYFYQVLLGECRVAVWVDAHVAS